MGNAFTRDYYMYLMDELSKKQIDYTQLKLHKLIYFANAYHLAKEETSFNVTFEAWKNGPVAATVRNDMIYNFSGFSSLYFEYYSRTEENKYKERLSEEEKKSIDYIITIMGDFEPYKLSSMTHNDVFLNEDDTERETPWKMHNPQGMKSKSVIHNQEISEFYTNEWFKLFEENLDIIKSKKVWE